MFCLWIAGTVAASTIVLLHATPGRTPMFHSREDAAMSGLKLPHGRGFPIRVRSEGAPGVRMAWRMAASEVRWKNGKPISAAKGMMQEKACNIEFILPVIILQNRNTNQADSVQRPARQGHRNLEGKPPELPTCQWPKPTESDVGGLQSRLPACLTGVRQGISETIWNLEVAVEALST